MKLIKTIGILIVIILLAGLCLNAIGVINAEDWYKNAVEEDKIVGTTDNGEVIEEGKTYALASTMLYTQSNKALANNMSATTQSTAVNLVATVLPHEATNKRVDWDVAWVDEDSTWASGKDVADYVTATPTEDGSTTASVECLEPFGEQIEITVTSRDNNSASATCVVDYMASFIDYVIKMDSTVIPENSTYEIGYTAHNNTPYVLSITPSFSVGTINPTSTTAITYTLGQRLKDFVGGPLGSSSIANDTFTYSDKYDFTYEGVMGLTSRTSDFESIYKSMLLDSDVDFIVKIVAFGEIKTFNINVLDSSFRIAVTGVSLDQTTLEF